MKKMILAILIFVIVTVLVFKAANANATSLDKNTILKHNGKQFKIGLFIYKNKIFVPLKPIAKQLGYKIDWDEEHSTIGTNKDKYFAQFQLGIKTIFICNDNQEDQITMDVVPIKISGMIYVPIKYLVESLGKYIETFEDKKIRVINITDIKLSHDVGE